MVRPPAMNPLSFIISILLQVNALTVHAAPNLVDEPGSSSPFALKLGKLTYNLSPLMIQGDTPEAQVIVQSPHEVDGTIFVRRLYSFNFDRTISIQRCPEDAWICMSETRGFHNLEHEAEEWVKHVPIANRQLQSSWNFDSIMSSASLSDDDPRSLSRRTLSFDFEGGIHNGKPQHASIKFFCDPGLEKPGQPVFAGELNGVHSFTWTTKYACPILDRTQVPPSDGSSVTLLETKGMTGVGSPPESDDTGWDEKGEQAQSMLSGNRTTFVIFVIASTSFLTFAILLSSPHRRSLLISQIQKLSATLRLPALFRRVVSFIPSSSYLNRRLAQWAEEDMALGVASIRYEDDAVDDDKWFEAGDEYIPLKTKRLTWQRNYGTADSPQI